MTRIIMMLSCMFSSFLKALVRAIVACIHKLGWAKGACRGDQQLWVITITAIPHTCRQTHTHTHTHAHTHTHTHTRTHTPLQTLHLSMTCAPFHGHRVLPPTLRRGSWMRMCWQKVCSKHKLSTSLVSTSLCSC